MNAPVYEVETIVDYTVIDNQPHFLIKWKGYTHDCDTWEPIFSLENIKEYLQYWFKERKGECQLALQKKIPVSTSQLDLKPKHGHRKIDRVRKAIQIEKERLSKAKLRKLEAFGERLMKKKQDVWKKYLPNELQKKGNIIVVDDSIQQPQSKAIMPPNCEYPSPTSSKAIRPTNCEYPSPTPSQHWQSQFSPAYKVKGQQVYESMEEAEEKFQEQLKQPNSRSSPFKVEGTIETSTIHSLISHFDWSGYRCLKVKLSQGQIVNMQESDLKAVCPQLLIQYYQMLGIPF